MGKSKNRETPGTAGPKADWTHLTGLKFEKLIEAMASSRKPGARPLSFAVGVRHGFADAMHLQLFLTFQEHNEFRQVLKCALY